MITVCHMTSAHPSEDIRIFQKECTSLAQNGYDVFLVARGESFESNGVKIVGTGESKGGRIRRILFETWKVYKMSKKIDADLYHFHDPELLFYGLLLKRAGKKVIFDSHEFYRDQIRIKEYLPKKIAALTSIIYGMIEDFVLARIDGVIFPCTKDGRHPFQGKCRNIAIVNNTPMLQELYEKYNPNVEKNDKSVCYIGSLTRARGVTNAIKASYLAGATLYLGGLFDSEDYKREIQNMPEYKNVVYLGLLDREQVVRTLQSCKIGMANLLNVGQYNAFDNLPTKVYEYMALGIPVVLSESSYNNELINKFRFGITVDPDSIDDTAAAISFILRNTKEAEGMSSNGRDAIKNHFNWDIDFNNMISLYNLVLSSNSN